MYYQALNNMDELATDTNMEMSVLDPLLRTWRWRRKVCTIYYHGDNRYGSDIAIIIISEEIT